ncbi:MAG TPA: histidine kinase [Luteibacter sp.]|jgi:signal transduction histidine kinase|nr:histidine kinase [Luteibacter sp.]
MPVAPAPTPEVAVDGPSTRLKRWTPAFGFWTLLVASYSISSLLSAAAEGRPSTWYRVLSWNVPEFYLWMALTPLVGFIARRTAGMAWRRFLAIQIPLAIAFAAFHTSFFLALYWLSGVNAHDGAALAKIFHGEFVYQFHLGLLTYGIILFVLRGLDAHRGLKDEKLRTSQLEAQLAQSELQALRMQLQPHFLFNTLNAISALALEDPMRAREMIARLSDFLRLTLEDGAAQDVSLSRELQFVECYLAIQEIRFQDRLVVEWDIGAATRLASVPHLILQPLIENALRHGLASKPDRGTLRIVAAREGDELRLVVEDDGIGLPPGAPPARIGLGNTRSRLRARFGADARLELLPGTHGGTRVELSLPYEECPA